MSQQGGKVNKSLKDWVSFVKKVQKEEKLSYKDAIIRAKARKDKGEKWMSGGSVPTTPTENTETDVMKETIEEVTPESEKFKEEIVEETSQNIAGGKRTRRRHRSRGRYARKTRSSRRSKSRSRGRR